MDEEQEEYIEFGKLTIYQQDRYGLEFQVDHSDGYFSSQHLSKEETEKVIRYLQAALDNWKGK